MTTVVVLVVAAIATGCGRPPGSRPASTPTPPTEIVPQATAVPGTPPPSRSPAPRATARSPTVRGLRVTVSVVARAEQPVAMEPVASGVTFVAEKTGRVRVLRGATMDPAPVLDLSGEVSTGSEQGLLGLAVSPDRSRLYVDFTDRAGDTRVREYPLHGESVDTAGARDVLRVEQPFDNHNGGDLSFGPDGMLYIALGDGGSGGDPQGNGQSLGTLLGKILRIDARASGGAAYTIPPGNPFAGRRGARPEIWAYGLRNPWRLSFDAATGDMWIGDVGQNAWEEVDVAPAGSRAGANYGWNRLEGTHTFSGSPPAGAVPPVYEYPTSSGCAVTGGFVYRGAGSPAMRGVYVFGDFCNGRIQGLVRTSEGRADHADLGAKVDQLSSFGVDADGELYALSLGGQILRVGT